MDNGTDGHKGYNLDFHLVIERFSCSVGHRPTRMVSV